MFKEAWGHSLINNENIDDTTPETGYLGFDEGEGNADDFWTWSTTETLDNGGEHVVFPIAATTVNNATYLHGKIHQVMRCPYDIEILMVYGNPPNLSLSMKEVIWFDQRDSNKFGRSCSSSLGGMVLFFYQIDLL